MFPCLEEVREKPPATAIVNQYSNRNKDPNIPLWDNATKGGVQVFESFRQVALTHLEAFALLHQERKQIIFTGTPVSPVFVHCVYKKRQGPKGVILPIIKDSECAKYVISSR